MAAWWGVAVALGLWISWRVRSGTAAIAATAGLLAALLVGNSFASYFVDGAVNVVASAGNVYGIRRWESLQIPDDEDIDLNQIYKKETGHAVSGSGINDAQRAENTQQFGDWLGKYHIRKIREHEWKADAAMWHPIVAITRLASTTDENFGDLDSYRYYNFNRRPEIAPHIGPFALLSLLFSPAL